MFLLTCVKYGHTKSDKKYQIDITMERDGYE